MSGFNSACTYNLKSTSVWLDTEAYMASYLCYKMPVKNVVIEFKCCNRKFALPSVRFHGPCV